LFHLKPGAQSFAGLYLGLTLPRGRHITKLDDYENAVLLSSTTAAPVSAMPCRVAHANSPAAQFCVLDCCAAARSSMTACLKMEVSGRAVSALQNRSACRFHSRRPAGYFRGGPGSRDAHGKTRHMNFLEQHPAAVRVSRPPGQKCIVHENLQALHAGAGRASPATRPVD